MKIEKLEVANKLLKRLKHIISALEDLEEVGPCRSPINHIDLNVKDVEIYPLDSVAVQIYNGIINIYESEKRKVEFEIAKL